MENLSEIDNEQVRDQLYQLIVSQLKFDAYTSLAAEVQAACIKTSLTSCASADLLHLLCPLLVNKTDAGVQCDLTDEVAQCLSKRRGFDWGDKDISDVMTQTETEDEIQEELQTLTNGHSEDHKTKRRRGRPKKTDVDKEKKEKRIAAVRLKRKGKSTWTSLCDSKRKQATPHKVVSQSGSVELVRDVEEETLEVKEERKEVSHNDQDWDPELESPPVKKKRGRPKVKTRKKQPKAEKENFSQGRPHAKRHTTCYGCDMTFDKASDCHTHVLTHFLETETQKICKICDKALAKSTMHQDHLKIHSSIRSFLCNICGATFNRKSSYDNHVEKHSRKKLYCDTCGNGPYNTAKQYERHLAVFHGGQVNKKWMCDVCGKGFYQKNKLDSHVRIHTGERPYTCSFCSATFRCKPHVQRHEEQHKGKKRFTCGVCNHATFQRSNMKVHMRVHSAVSYAETRLFVCPLCRSCFHTDDLFEIHKSSKHPNYEQDVDALTDTIGIGKIKMLINPPNRMPAPKVPKTDSESGSQPKQKRTRTRVKTVPTDKPEESVVLPSALTEDVNCIGNKPGAMLSLNDPQPVSEPLLPNSSELPNTSGVSVNTFSVPATTTMQPVLFSTGPVAQPPHQPMNSAPGMPMDYPGASDFSMLMQTVAAAAHVGGTASTGNFHPNFMQQPHFTNMH